MLGIPSELEQRLGSGPEERAVEHTRVVQGDRPQQVRQRKYDVEVLDRKQFPRAVLEPLRSGRSLALRTVAVAARVVGDTLMPALVADLDVTAESRRATTFQVA